MRKFFDAEIENKLYIQHPGESRDPQISSLDSGFRRNAEGERAWVVFSGKSDWPWLKFLRPGFRHCFVIVHDGARWLSLDPLLQHTELKVHDVPADFDLTYWLTARGNKVMPAPLDRDHNKPAPFMLFTCVEAVKRVLGLHRLSVITPWQLYRHLARYNNNLQLQGI